MMVINFVVNDGSTGNGITCDDSITTTCIHYDDVIMTMLASQITSLTVVYSIVYSGVNQRKHQSSASLAFVREIHRGPVNFPHKWPVTRKMFPFDDVIMLDSNLIITVPLFKVSWLLVYSWFRIRFRWSDGIIRRLKFKEKDTMEDLSSVEWANQTPHNDKAVIEMTFHFQCLAARITTILTNWSRMFFPRKLISIISALKQPINIL